MIEKSGFVGKSEVLGHIFVGSVGLRVRACGVFGSTTKMCSSRIAVIESHGLTTSFAMAEV